MKGQNEYGPIPTWESDDRSPVWPTVLVLAFVFVIMPGMACLGIVAGSGCITVQCEKALTTKPVHSGDALIDWSRPRFSPYQGPIENELSDAGVSEL